MKILFIDYPSCSYDTTTHLKEPLGGTQSAVSCLSKALAQAGHKVAIVNGNKEPTETDGVRFMTLPCPTPVLNDFDVIVLISATMSQMLRRIGLTRPIVLWAHHATNQPAVQKLGDPAERSLYTGFVMVSQWQAESYIAAFGLNPSAIKVLRNAVSSPFINSTPATKWLRTGAAPILGYSSTPYRGLDILLLSFPSIRKRLEGATLRIFSGMWSYASDIQSAFTSLYDLAHALPGVTYVGPLPQPRLAEEMANVDIWAYPCTFEETSCISAMEAMTSGNLLVSTTLGALPETTAGFAHLIDFNAAHVLGENPTRFANHLVNVATEFRANPQSAESTIARQVDYARTHYNWNVRATEWVEWLEQTI
jgi:glycosyltransferase involved in cell wall biosynthesis